jgi:hypothetical protein
MLFIRKPTVTPAEYALISPVYGLNDHGDDVPLMTRRDAMRAARYFLAMVDDPDAAAQVVNTTNQQVYTIQRSLDNSNVYVVTWAKGGC